MSNTPNKPEKKEEKQKQEKQLETVHVTASSSFISGGKSSASVSSRTNTPSVTTLPSVQAVVGREEGNFDEKGLELLEAIGHIPVPKPFGYVAEAASELGTHAAKNLINIRKRTEKELENIDSYEP